MTRETFPEQEIPDEAIREYTATSTTVAPYPIQARIRIHTPAAEVREQFEPSIATVAAESDDTSILVAGAQDPVGFAMYLGTAGIEFEVMEGEELRVSLSAVADRLLRAGRQPSDGSPISQHRPSTR